MRKSNVKKIILIMALVIIAVLLVSKVYATGTVVNPVQVPISTNTTNSPSADTNTANTTNTNTTTIAPTTQTNTTSSTYTNTNLPQTGDASDYAIFLLIVVSVVVAIFAYKKVRDYNI